VSLRLPQHARLVHHQHRVVAQPLVVVVEVGQQPVAGGHLLEPLRLQADGGDPGRGTGQEPVAVQLPGMPGDAEGEGLAGPRPPDHQGDAGAALVEVADHPGLVLAGGRVGGQRRPHRVVTDHGGLFAGPAGGGSDQPPFDPEELRGGPAALLQRPVGHHRHRPFDQEPVGQPLQLDPAGAGEVAAERGDDVLAGEGGRLGGQPVRTGQPVEHLGHHPLGQRRIPVQRPVGHLPHQGVRVHAALGRLRPPAVVQGVRRLVPLGLAGGLHGPLDQPRRPRPPVGGQPVDLGVDLVGALGEPPGEVLGQALSSRLPWASAAVHATPSVLDSWRW
jgi:hypothetical protein